MVDMLIALIVLCVAISAGVPVIISLVHYSRKKKHQSEWNAMKRKLELEHKSEDDIRCAYFEYCKKLVGQHNDCFGWGIPEIGHINVRRRSDDSKTVAE